MRERLTAVWRLTETVVIVVGAAALMRAMTMSGPMGDVCRFCPSETLGWLCALWGCAY